MPGTRGGTGQPLVFRCAKCRRRGGGFNWRPTGRARGDINKPVHGRVSRTVKVEYVCECGHIGWSGHHSVIERARQMVKDRKLYFVEYDSAKEANALLARGIKVR